MKTIGRIAAALNGDNPNNYANQYYQPPVVPQISIPLVSNPMSQINPYYTQQQSIDALAPMQMYQNYKATGTLPQQASSFVPFNSPAATFAPVSTPTQIQAAPKASGGK